MSSIVDMYTAPGPNFSQRVLDEISKCDEAEPKAAELKAFLIEWADSHAIEV